MRDFMMKPGPWNKLEKEYVVDRFLNIVKAHRESMRLNTYWLEERTKWAEMLLVGLSEEERAEIAAIVESFYSPATSVNFVSNGETVASYSDKGSCRPFERIK